MCNSLSLWEPGETEPDITFMSRTDDIDPQNPRKIFRKTAISFCVLPDGRVVASPVSPDDYVITCFSSDGEIAWEIDRPFRRTERTEEEVEIEKEMMHAAIRRNGGNPALVEQMDFNRWAEAVNSLQITGTEICARRGGTVEPRFDVFDMDGVFLYTCSIPELPFGSSIAVRVSAHGFLAYIANPEDYSRIFLLEKVTVPGQ